MLETNGIRYATLHLDGEAHEWWYHGLVMLWHANITSYLEITQNFIDRFDNKDPKLHFRELAQLKKIGTVDAYISYFHRIMVMVMDLLENMMIIIFIEGLSEPLCG